MDESRFESGVGAHLGRRVADGDFLRDASNRHRDSHRRRRSIAHRHSRRRRLKAFEASPTTSYRPAGNAGELKFAVLVRGRRLHRPRVAEQLYLRRRQHAARLIDDRTRDSHTSALRRYR